MNLSWLQHIQEKTFPDGHKSPLDDSTLDQAFILQALKEGKTVTTRSMDKIFTGNIADFIDQVQNTFKGRLVRQDEFSKRDKRYLFIWDSAYLNIYYYSPTSRHTTTIDIGGFDKDFVNALATEVNKYLTSKIRQGTVCVLTKDEGGLGLTSLESEPIPFEHTNYMPDVFEKYNHIINDLNNYAPCGRLIILHGSPGSGKSYLLRSLLTKVPKALFVVIPPAMIAHLSDPDLMTSIISSRNENENSGPSILMVEDADNCLLPRGSDNISEINNLLNFGDGILGSLLDVRIIATTNANKLEFDKALLRAGRLCQSINIGMLSPVQADAVYQRLTGRSKTYEKPMVLADIYADAKSRLGQND